MFRFIFMVVCVVILVSPASAENYPSGLSDNAKAKFEAYEARIITAIRNCRSANVSARDMAVMFPSKQGLAIIRQVFGDDWTPIRERADAELADLPLVDEAERFAGKPASRLSLGEIESRLRASLSKMKEFEESMAAARLWDPMQVATSASMMLLGHDTPEQVAFHSVSGGYVSQHLARTTWQGRDALVLYAGDRVFAMNYMRTRRGLIWTTEIGVYPR